MDLNEGPDEITRHVSENALRSDVSLAVPTCESKGLFHRQVASNNPIMIFTCFMLDIALGLRSCSLYHLISDGKLSGCCSLYWV